jgi:hypothetical protein
VLTARTAADAPGCLVGSAAITKADVDCHKSGAFQQYTRPDVATADVERLTWPSRRTQNRGSAAFASNEQARMILWFQDGICA